MKTRRRTPLVLLRTCALFVPALAVHAATDESFLLTGTAKDFDTYFPTYLANGYFSTMTAPRGSEGNLAYMVAFMDYTKDDIARPAAIPGFTEIDYDAGATTAGDFWLNRTRLDDKAFRDYRQTLNMHDATLTTSYTWVDGGGKATAIRITTFVSQAARHIAVSRFSITPDFSGTVTLKFPLNKWAPHRPRFPIAKMNGEQMREAVFANNLPLDQPIPPATPDRAAVWYHGDTHVLDEGGDRDDLTVWLDGRAERGLRMAEAAAIGLPAGARAKAVKLIQTPYTLGLTLQLDVEKGKTYDFTKYVAMSRETWGGDGRATAALAREARNTGFDQLLAAHASAWHDLWRSDVVIEGDPKVQQVVHSDLYYLLSNSTVGTSWPMGACALTPNYAGHAFWDSDSWVFPALLLLHPERARPIVMFRYRTIPPARDRARQYGAKGTMYPWESDPETGVDHTPYFAYDVYREIHVNADIAIAQWQYYLATGDDAWLKQYGWPVIEGIAQFWTSRVTWNKDADRYEIHHVTSPDEAYSDVPNDSFTNAAARKALRIAVEAARRVGAKPDPQWTRIADKMYIPFKQSEQRHLDFDESVPHDKTTWMGSSLSWLVYPNLDLKMPPQVRRNDFAFQLHELKVHGDDPNEMMMVMLAVNAAELGQDEVAGDWIQRNLVGFVKPPFNVRTETATNNAGYILATSAGFIQSFVYGLSGLRIDGKGLDAEYPPVLPPGWKSLTLKNVAFRGQRFDVVIDRDANGKVKLSRRKN